jgi:hypothetical protein
MPDCGPLDGQRNYSSEADVHFLPNYSKELFMNRFNFAILTFALAVLGGCANMPGSMVGTSAVSGYDYGEYQPKGAWPDQKWVQD